MIASDNRMISHKAFLGFGTNLNFRARLAILLASLLAGCLIAPVCAAADKASGTWTWSFTMQNGDAINLSLKLKQDGEKLTGVYSRAGANATEIKDGKLQDDDLSFTVVREFNGNSFTLKYAGKLNGDTIKGKVEFEGQSNPRDWEAKRETAKADATGLWQWSLTTPDGQNIDLKLRLKQDGEKLTGASIFADNEAPITEGTVKEDQVYVKVLRDRDGRQVTITFHGKLSGDTIKGKWDSDWSGENRTRDWDAKRVKE
jgi:hypothetical protein